MDHPPQLPVIIQQEQEPQQMRIVVTSNGRDLDAPASLVFGRCPFFVFVDAETMAYEAVANPAISAAGGAGIQAAQFVVQQGAQAALTGHVGPNAFNVFQAAGVPVLLIGEGTVRHAVEAYQTGRLEPSGDANVQAHAGMARPAAAPVQLRGAAATTVAPTQAAPRQAEIAALQQTAADLRRQLAGVIERIDKLERDASS
jgi:predicted Fe-Mo cluster-binding NifX family protein